MRNTRKRRIDYNIVALRTKSKHVVVITTPARLAHVSCFTLIDAFAQVSPLVVYTRVAGAWLL